MLLSQPIIPKMSVRKYALILVPLFLFVWKPSSIISILASNVYQNIIIGVGALNQLTYVPALLTSTLLLLFLFVVFLNLSYSTYIDQCILYYYTSMTRKIHLPKNRTPKQFTPSISFMGGGQLWMFALGVGHYIFENFEISAIKYLASSSGCFVAVPLACGLDPYEWCKRDWGTCMAHFESRGILGCLWDTKHFYYQLWNEYLPTDAHLRCSGKLFISVTLFPSMRNRVVSHFASREDLIWTIVASMCLPFAFIRDFPVKCCPQLGWCIDGGFSNDAPCLDSYTITVSALHREADIRPLAPGTRLPAAAAPAAVLATEPASSSSPSRSPAATPAAAVEGAKGVATIDCGLVLSQPACPGPVSGPDSVAVTEVQCERITMRDIIRVPKYSRVWEVSSMAEISASLCQDFDRHEWMSIRKKPPVPAQNGQLEGDDSQKVGGEAQAVSTVAVGVAAAEGKEGLVHLEAAAAGLALGGHCCWQDVDSDEDP